MINQRDDRMQYKQQTRRSFLVFGLQLATSAALAGRIYHLQVVDSPRYKVLAVENRINWRLIAPKRGEIFDRSGYKLAINQQNYRVVLIQEQADSVDETLKRLGQLITITESQKAKIKKNLRKNSVFVPVTITENLSWEDFTRVNFNIPSLPGIVPEAGLTRYYPEGEIFSHTVGYVGAVSEKDKASMKAPSSPLLALPHFRTGKEGIERMFEYQLRGTAGSQQIEVNAIGRVIRMLETNEGILGSDITLTMDITLQRLAMKLLHEKSGAIIVMDTHNGDILTLASSPSFNPNDFVLGISHENWNSLISNTMSPLTNKAVSGTYPPGSTFKMITALAALEAGVVNRHELITCRGHSQLGNHLFHCWKKGGHGSMHIIDAIRESCDVFFYEIARRTGIDRIAKMASQFGIGQNLDLVLPNVKSGLVPTIAWKKAHYDTPWQTGETLISGIGQGYISTTPMELAIMVARIANSKYKIKPRLVHKIGDTVLPYEKFDSLIVDPVALAIIRTAMREVVAESTGTAHHVHSISPSLAGKTGTAQVRRISRKERNSGIIKNKDLPIKLRDHALFVAYAPADNPRFSISVIVEHGGSGSRTAAPLAATMMRKTLEVFSEKAELPENNQV
jgi:penicillin-binding protein 2